MSIVNTISKLGKSKAFSSLKNAKPKTFFNKAMNGDDMKRSSEAVYSKIFQKVKPDEAENLSQAIMGMKMKKGVGIAGMVGVSAYAVGSGLIEQNRVAKAGRVKGEQTANTIGPAYSPTLQGELEKMERNPEYEQQFIDEGISNTQGGVEPSIVFALHDLRN